MEAQDEKRTRFLNQRWNYVLRFSNNAIRDNFSGVCETINQVLDSLTGSDFAEFEPNPDIRVYFERRTRL